MDVQVSRYNFVFPYNHSSTNKLQRVLYNSRTGALALIEEEKYRMYEAFAKEQSSIGDIKLLNDLRRGGFIVDSSMNELEVLRYNLLRSRYDSASFSLTIAPTSNCNFRCIYCYEKDSIQPITMSIETQNYLLEFVKDHLQCVERFSVTWYGGEPLLALGIIERLTKQFLELCDDKSIIYSADIVTNGYLLDNHVVDKLVELRINSIQITLDGAAEDHDRRRPLVGGFPTFDHIVDNLCLLSGRTDVSIAIRINADKHNIDRVDRVVDLLREKNVSGNIRPYLAMVENINGSYNDNSCFHTNEFSKIIFDFVLRNNLDILAYIPVQVANYCGADSVGSYVINADGLIYKCWSEMGIKERSIGSVKNGVNNMESLLSYMLYDATTDEKCSQCKYLPICMGGCPYLRITHPSLRCSSMKHSLKSFMDVIPAFLESQNK